MLSLCLAGQGDGWHSLCVEQRDVRALALEPVLVPKTSERGLWQALMTYTLELDKTKLVFYGEGCGSGMNSGKHTPFKKATILTFRGRTQSIQADVFH